VEKIRLEGKVSHLRLVAAPLSVADDLRRMFYEAKDSSVLCSATFRVGNDFKYISRRLGCGERFQVLTAESPFDYFRQALVLAPDFLPDPSVDGATYAESLASTLFATVEAVGGRTLVLFTSYEMMNAVAEIARKGLSEAGYSLLVQGEGMSREAMTRRLKTDSSTVVFGAQSFWEGVDVAGEALSCVVLARLPFAQIGDPVVEARSEKIDREGGSSFRDYALPEAVVKFRQGFGRLIRTKSDRGVVIVADPRIVTKNYGAVFRKSIPATVHTVSDIGELVERIHSFL
jgi:Rad3-related DNA helicase